nr:hypothetical protein [Synechococcus sp. CBW1004]
MQAGPYNRTGGDDHTILQDGAIQKDTVSADPDIIANTYPPPTRKKTLLTNQLISIFKGMINGSKGTICGYGHIIANGDTISGIDNATRIDHTSTANPNCAQAASGLEFDEAINDRIFANGDQRSSRRWLNVSQ